MICKTISELPEGNPLTLLKCKSLPTILVNPKYYSMTPLDSDDQFINSLFRSKDLPHQYRVLIDMRGEKAIDQENIVYIYGDKQEIFYLGVLNDISERNSSVGA